MEIISSEIIAIGESEMVVRCNSWVLGYGFCLVAGMLASCNAFSQSGPSLIKRPQAEVVKQSPNEQYRILETTRKKALKNDWTINRVSQPEKEIRPTATLTAASIPAPVNQTNPNMLFVTEGSSASLLQ